MLGQIVEYAAEITGNQFKVDVLGDTIILLLWESGVSIAIEGEDVSYDSSYGDNNHVIWDGEFIELLAEIIRALEGIITEANY